MEPDPKGGYVLSSLAEVVERILGFLPTKALLRAACVCQLWRECSRRILRTQQSITWVSALEPGPSNTHVLVHVLAEDIEKVQVLPQTVLYIIADAETFSENREFCVYGLKKGMDFNSQNSGTSAFSEAMRAGEFWELSPHLSELPDLENTEAGFTLIRSMGDLGSGQLGEVAAATLQTLGNFLQARRRYSKEIAAALENLLPTRCQVLGLVTPGVVATPKGSGSHRPLEVEEGEAGFALLFPKIDGVKIQTFHFFKDPKRQTIDEEQFAEAGLKNNPDLRAVLLFGYNTWKSGSTRFLRQIVNRLNEKSIILAGGYVESITSLTLENHNQPAESCGVVGLAFSGPQIRCASVLLDQDVTDEKSAEAAMQRLKAAHLPEHHSLAFMFACVGRGCRFYKSKPNLEADAFRKYFPDVPLFGFFGHGEIGCDRIVTGNFVLRECNETKDDLLHGYTTVVTLLHLGSAKANQA